MNSLVLGLLIAAAASQGPARPPAADPAVPGLEAPVVSGVDQAPEPSTPFRNLFGKAASEPRRQERLRARERLEETLATLPQGVAGGRPKVVCGMVVMQADPTVDAGMIQRPRESTTTMHIRKIPPAACAE